MSVPFDARRGLVRLMARVWGPRGPGFVKMALDTGATHTVLNVARLRQVGFEPDHEPAASVTTGGGVIAARWVVLPRFAVLGQERAGFRVLTHEMPTTAQVDGVVGLDFLRGQRLTVDFRAGTIDLV